MQINEFKPNESFFTATGEWICLDVGTRVVVAIKKEDYQTQESWDSQPDDKFCIFYSYDFGGCSLNKMN